jgi:hypothetical protein
LRSKEWEAMTDLERAKTAREYVSISENTPLSWASELANLHGWDPDVARDVIMRLRNQGYLGMVGKRSGKRAVTIGYRAKAVLEENDEPVSLSVHSAIVRAGPEDRPWVIIRGDTWDEVEEKLNKLHEKHAIW